MKFTVEQLQAMPEGTVLLKKPAGLILFNRGPNLTHAWAELSADPGEDNWYTHDDLANKQGWEFTHQATPRVLPANAKVTADLPRAIETVYELRAICEDVVMAERRRCVAVVKATAGGITPQCAAYIVKLILDGTAMPEEH